MAPHPLPLCLLVLATVAERERRLGSSSHSLKFVAFIFLEPSWQLPYAALAYLDGQVAAHYNRSSRKIQPRVSWLEKMGEDVPQYWEALTNLAHDGEEWLKEDLAVLSSLYRTSKGLHILQGFASCGLLEDGSKRGIILWAFDAETRLTLNMYEPLLENCVDLLEKCLSYGNETLPSTEPPVVTVTRRTEMVDGMETHVCRVHGFYPREIDASWTRDGEVWLEDTFHGSVAPNADGTHHHWLSIQIDPKERGRYQCHVEHDGLQEPLDVPLKDPGSNLGLIIGCVVAVLVLLCVIVGTLIFFRNHSSGPARVDTRSVRREERCQKLHSQCPNGVRDADTSL